MNRFVSALIPALMLLAAGCSDRSAEPASSPKAEPVTAASAPVPAESDRAFALRALGLPTDVDGLNLTPATWNGRSVLFVDYSRVLPDAPADEPGLAERPVVALWRAAGGGFERADVTVGEQEGGEPRVAAIGFANADRDPADELIVLLEWHVSHYDVSGTMYGVRILDDARPGQTALVELKDVSRVFEADSCDCDRREGPSDRARFRTIRDVKAELKRLGY